MVALATTDILIKGMYQRVNAHDTKSYSVLSGLLLEIVRVLVGSRMSVHDCWAVFAIMAESSPAPAVSKCCCIGGQLWAGLWRCHGVKVKGSSLARE